MPKKHKKPAKPAKAAKAAKATKSKPVKASRPRAKSKKPPVTMILRTGSRPVVEKKETRQAPIPPLTNDQITKFREVLSQKRDDLMAIVQRKKEEEIEDIGVGDEADIATHSVEKEMLFELTDSEKQTLDMVEAALIKMDKGVFGSCESCQKPILRMRLQVMPWARYCVSCQSEQEVPAGE
jgi:DnaK suppressor protein